MDTQEIMLYPVIARWNDTGIEFRTNVGYFPHFFVDVPTEIVDTVFWWSDDVPHDGMDMDDAVLVRLNGQPTLIDIEVGA